MLGRGNALIVEATGVDSGVFARCCQCSGCGDTVGDKTSNTAGGCDADEGTTKAAQNDRVGVPRREKILLKGCVHWDVAVVDPE